jgi:hypothetical protein
VLVLPGVGPALTLAGFLAVPRLLPLPPVRRRLVRELGLLPTSSVDDVVRQIRRRDWRAFVVEQRALVREIAGLAARLPEVDTPAIVLGGRLDFMLLPRLVRELAATLLRAGQPAWLLDSPRSLDSPAGANAASARARQRSAAMTVLTKPVRTS